MTLAKEDIEKRLINNDSLFNYIHVIQQQFDIIPSDKQHIGSSIAFQDIQELRIPFIESLYDTITEWVYSLEKYKFKEAFTDSINSIINSYENLHDELRLYTHEDFLDNELNAIAESYLNNTLENPRVELVSIVMYNETTKIEITNQDIIHQQIDNIIKLFLVSTLMMLSLMLVRF